MPAHAQRMSSLLALDREGVFCRVAKRVYSEVRLARAGRREAAGDRDARRVAGRTRLQIRSRARGGAYVEHVGHLRDAGGVKAQRLVERRRELPRVERGAHGVV